MMLHRLIFLPIREQGTSSQIIGITVGWDAGDETGMLVRGSGRGWEQVLRAGNIINGRTGH